MIQIYSENNTNYDYNGDVVLDPEVCDLKVTLNGSWEVTLECALDEEDKFQEILTNAVLSTDTPVGKKQLFRLYDVQRSDTGVIAYARPIFLDSSKDVFFTDCRPTELTGQEALDYLMKGTPYSGYTDITLKKTAYYIRKNLIEAIAGNEDNSFLNRWGGEIVYDNYKVNILVQQGEDRGLRVEFGTNIESIQETIDVDEMGTRLIPVAFNGRTLDGDEPWVDSPLIDNYPIIYHKIVEFEDMRLTEDFNLDEDGNPTEDMDDYDVYDTLAELQAAMVERCEQLFVEGIDTPSITYDVSMIDLRQTDEYKEYQDLETVNLGDTVYCYHRRLGIETKARVIEYTFDCIRQCITEVVIGDYQEDYLDHLSDITSSSGGNVDFSQIWSQFDYIEANYVKTNQLEAEIGKFGYLTAAEADITYARITDLDAALIEVNELIAQQIYAISAEIGVLDANVANIISLLGGDIATGTLDTIHLTADNAIIDSEVVLSALIEEAIIGDLLAGYIYTDYITIMDNENGNMILTGPTIQFQDSDGNYRMQVGLDGDGNFNIYILNEAGDVIFDALGLTEAGLIGNGAIIRDVAVADDANISGYKLNIQEVATILNEDGSLIIDAGQVIINGETLSAVYTEIRQDVDSALTEAEKALEAAGELVEIGARNYLLNTKLLTEENDKTFYNGFSRSEDESEFGVLTEESSGSFTDLTAISAQKNSLSGKKMVFSCELFEENLTSILDDYELEFGIYISHDDGETWNDYATISSTLNEDDVFEFNREDLVDNEWTKLIAKFTATASHMHSTNSRPTFIWDDSDMTCKVTYTCDSCGEEVTEDCNVTERVVDATCENDGSITYTASFTSENVTYTDEKVTVIPALKHDWDSNSIVYTWATDYSSCQLSVTCRDCGETFTYNSTSVTSKITKEATCTEDGNTEYTANFDIPEGRSGTSISGTVTNIAIPALGHDYSHTFNWASDYSKCTATFTCSRGDSTETVDCAIEIVTIPATCEVDGMSTYTATCTFEGKEYTDTKTETIPATGHDWGQPEFTWGNDHKSCTATFICNNCGESDTVDCTVEIITVPATCTVVGSITYTASVTFNGETYISTSYSETIPATGHTYKDPVFNWTDDYSECTATFDCESGDDSQVLDCSVDIKTVDATDTTDGSITYTATVTFNGTEYTDIKVETIPALGHTYGEPTFEWADDYSSCVAVFECVNFDDTQRINCDIVKETDDVGCNEPGTITYTASVIFNGETYTDIKTETVEAVGHDYGEPTFNWASDLSSCEATFVCSRGDSTENVNCTVSSEITKEATCTDDGIETYTASVTFDGKTYTDEKENIIPALGHDYGEPIFNWTENKKTIIDIPYEPSGDIIESGQLGDDVWYDIYENGYCRVYGSGETYTYSPMNPSSRSPLYQNSEIKILVIDGNVTAINDAVFLQSTVENVFMQNSEVNSICDNSFQQCTSLKTVVFSSELSKISTYAFNQDTALENIIFIGNVPDSIDSRGYGSFTDVVATCYYPSDNSTWNDFDFGDYGGTLTWQATEYEYEVSGYSCTATFTCSRCDDSFTLDCTVTETQKDATCEDNGYTRYTASVTFNDTTYTDIKMETIPALGHDYGEPVFNWSDNYESCTATFTCSRCNNTETVNCTVTVDGNTYTATVEFNGQTYTDIIKPTDKKLLEIYIEMSEALVASDYTSNSWAEFSEKLDNAKTVYNNGEAEQDEVDEALYALDDAYDILDIVMDNIIASGTTNGDNATWTITESGTIIFEGEGDIVTTSLNATRPWRNYTDDINLIIIKFGITSLGGVDGEYGLYDCCYAQFIRIPKSLSSICARCFSSSSNDNNKIKYFIALGSLEYVGLRSFYQSDGLKYFYAPNGKTDYSSGYTFYQVVNMIDCIISDDVSEIGQYFLRECSSLESFRVPSNVTDIPTYTFYKCSNLKSVTFSGDAPTIGSRAFDGTTDVICYYPADNNTWATFDFDTYSGTRLTWVAY